MNKTTIILLSSIFLLSCGQPSINANQEYKSVLNKYPAELTEHFPKNILDSYNYSEGFNNEYSPIHFMSKVIYPKADFDSIINELSYKVKYEYLASDSNLIVINYLNSEKNTLDLPNLYLTQRQNKMEENYVPIPNFLDSHNKTSNICNLSDNYIIKVIEFLPDSQFDNFHNEGNWGLPEGFEDGASYGIASNHTNGTIIYWLSIW